MSDIDPRTLANGDLEAEVATLSAQLDVAEHRLLALTGELDGRQRQRDPGLPSLAAWLSWRVGLGPVAAREKVRGVQLLPDHRRTRLKTAPVLDVRMAEVGV